MKKKITTFGIEYDETHIRAVKALHGKRGEVQLDGEMMLEGSFFKDEEIIAGLKQIKSDMGIGSGDHVSTCLAGKQVYAAQIPFRKVPRSELDTALTFEIKKHIPFDVATAAVEYDVVSDDADNYQVLATAVQKQTLTRLLTLFGKAGLKPAVVDLLPLALANAGRRGDGDGTPAVMLHVGPGISTLVFSAEGIPFFTRNVYFTAHDLFGENPKVDSERERERRLVAFAGELERSLAYYTGTFHPPEMGKMLITGEYGHIPELNERITQAVKLPVEPLKLFSMIHNSDTEDDGTYALATVLSLRTDIP